MLALSAVSRQPCRRGRRRRQRLKHRGPGAWAGGAVLFV